MTLYEKNGYFNDNMCVGTTLLIHLSLPTKVYQTAYVRNKKKSLFYNKTES